MRFRPTCSSTLQKAGPSVALTRAPIQTRTPSSQSVNNPRPFHFKLVVLDRMTQGLAQCAPLLPATAMLGDRIEVSPARDAWTRAICAKLTAPASAWLCIDYGAHSGRADSLRGIRDNRVTSPFSMPGSTDLSFDVDFGRLSTVSKDNGVEVHATTQRDFLSGMGIGARVAKLFTTPGITPQQRTDLISGAKRLVDAMGHYVVTAGVPAGQPAPYPFSLPEAVHDGKDSPPKNAINLRKP